MADQSNVIAGSLTTDLVPGKVDYTVLVPSGVQDIDGPLPLLVNMHGGGLDHTYLAEPSTRAMYEKLWKDGSLPPAIVACYNARAGWHLNYIDGSELWEDFTFEFIDHIRSRYNIGEGPNNLYLTGISMGAMGALRLVLKYPDKFAAVAAQEGIVNPVLKYDDLQPRNYAFQHNTPPEEQARRWGWPVDRAYYRANNHANIAVDNATAIRAAAPSIYLECGDKDYFNGHDGAEFVHRIMWDNRIEHEYRLLHDCDHVGKSLVWRVEDAHRWLGRMMRKHITPESYVPSEPSAAQERYFQGVMNGEIQRPPSKDERAGIMDDEFIGLSRKYLPKFITDFADDPLGGVFRKK